MLNPYDNFNSFRRRQEQYIEHQQAQAYMDRCGQATEPIVTPEQINKNLLLLEEE